MNLRQEQESYQTWLEEHPPLLEGEGWICPRCDQAHRTKEQACECCFKANLIEANNK